MQGEAYAADRCDMIGDRATTFCTAAQTRFSVRNFHVDTAQPGAAAVPRFDEAQTGVREIYRDCSIGSFNIYPEYIGP